MSEQLPVDGVLGLVAAINTWKKVAIIIVLGVVSLSGWLLYEYRREVTYWALNEFGTPKIDETTIRDESAALMRRTGATSISVWSVNLQRNERTSLYVRIGEQRLTELEGLSDMAIRPDTPHSRHVIELLNNNTTCYELIKVSAVGEAAGRAGVTWVCSASIPPRAGVFLGILALGFTQKPADEDFIRLQLAQAAEQMIR
jgi:hypothetical protein